ncbi:putative secreted protein (Por secretion system target) [Tenacibaculum sp. 190524A02b]|uniref:Secreted protein (Por secretion system target) n=1 Tax=Tenacibaculum vairaonense TaxID=3137860 RepID=A0ABM9PGW3_9FLAO
MVKKLLSLLLFIGSYAIFSQQNYYNDVDLTKSGLALKDELATKIVNTHTRTLSYSQVWDACKATDVNPDNSNEVLLIYGYSSTGTTARTRGINENGGSTGDWNREHTYPKSLGNPNLGTSGAGADAHHLRPSDVQHNGKRGSKKFASGSGNSGDSSGGWYPGDEWKGDVARMMLYMYLRYGNQCLPKNVAIGTTNSVDSNMIDLLLQWNADDPVSSIEDARNTYHENTSNSAAQGNRNPFIDNPNLATQIWGGPVAENRWATANINENSLLETKIFPNPSSIKKVFIKVNDNLKIQEVTLYSILGKTVYNVKNPISKNGLISINNLTKGIYLLKIANRNSSMTKKIIIQ